MKVLGVIGGLLLLAGGLVLGLCQQELWRIATTKSNLHQLQLAIERYRVEDDWVSYPLDIESVTLAGYLPDLPINSYSGEPMRQVRLEDQPTPGDFIYLPAPEDLRPGYQIADNYLLLVYRARMNGIADWTVRPSDLEQAGWKTVPAGLERIDWNRVALVLQNGTSDHEQDPWVIRRATEATENLRTIQLSVEKYAASHTKSGEKRAYPASLQLLRDEGMLADLPRNPYDPAQGPMPEVALGEHLAGGFTYLPLVPNYEHVRNASPAYPFYLLVAYGDEPDPRLSARDHIYLHEPAELIDWEYVVAAMQSEPAQ